MSQENVEIVRQVLDGFSHSDRGSVEPLLHPDLEWRSVIGPLLGVETISGRDAMLRFAFEDIPDAIENQHVEVEELQDLGEGGFWSWGDMPVGVGEVASNSISGSPASTASARE